MQLHAIAASIQRNATAILIGALCFELGISFACLFGAVTTPEFWSVIGAFLGSIFTVGGGAVLWAMQTSELSQRAGKAVQAICEAPAGMLRWITGPTYDRFGADEYPIKMTRVSITNASDALKRFSATWQSMTGRQMKLLLAIEHMLVNIAGDLERATQTYADVERRQ